MRFTTLLVTLFGLVSTTTSHELIFEYPGCTDPIALNYDPDATVDNGTCVYSIGPDLIIIDIDITNYYCNSLDVEVYFYTATVVNIGTEDIDYFCLSDFLGGSSYNCFNGAVNSAVYVAALDTIQVNGNLSTPGGWFDGQMNYMSVVSVPGEIVTGNNNFVFDMVGDLDCSGGNGGGETGCDTVYVQLPPDTIVEIVYDTLYVDNYITEYDTVYITNTDTVYVDNYITEYDTIYIQLPPDTITQYIFQTDTVMEYIVQEIYIDCNTGLPCDTDPYWAECGDWADIYVPTAFTPNNDGVDDIWEIKYDMDCWDNVEFWVYDRWGVEVCHGRDSEFDEFPFWNGSFGNGDYYVSDGVYVYVVIAKKSNEVTVIRKVGHVTIFR